MLAHNLGFILVEVVQKAPEVAAGDSAAGKRDRIRADSMQDPFRDR